MKYLFLVIAAGLLAASAVLRHSYPDVSAHVPVVYWSTDINPARTAQASKFDAWLTEEGYVTPNGEPMVQLRLDLGGSGDKQIIRGVSGVGGDLIDMGPFPYYQRIGLLTDVTDSAKELHFDPSHTWPAIEPAITIDGRQFAFPCVVSVRSMIWVNRATFERYGIDPPPARWTLDDFERIGKELVAAANEPGKPQQVFMIASLDLRTLHRSMGLSRYNETMSGSALNDPRFAEALALKRQWTHVDHLLPTLAERDSFDVEGGFGGAALGLFSRGNYALYQSGRYALIQLRKFGDLDLAVVEPPHQSVPNVLISTRCAGVYAAGKHPELARLFLAYLASEAYNMHIVDDADALPPNPIYTQTEAFLRPPDHPNEWGVHGVIADAARNIAAPIANSPFVFDHVVERHVNAAEEACLAGRLSPEEAALQAHERVEAEIAMTLQEEPQLRALYEQLLADQRTIDQLRAEGKPVPIALIRNPFHRYLYQREGWLAE